MTAARDYLLSHGIDLELAAECGVRSDGLNLYFPYEAPDGTKYERARNMVDGITKQPAGRQLDVFWPLGKAAGMPILLCEGEADTLAAASVLEATDHPMLEGLCPVGIPGASFPMGRACRELGTCRPIYVCFDPDEAGTKAAKRFVLESERRLTAKVVVCNLPDGKDLADCLVDQAPEDRADWLANLLADHEADGNVDHLVASHVKERLSA